MLGLLSDNINNGLLFIYGLIAVVVVLIIIIVIIDRKDNKLSKSKRNLTDTLSMKPIKDDDFENKDIEILNMISGNTGKINLESISKVEVKKEEPIVEKYEYIREERIEPVREEVSDNIETIEETKYEEPEEVLEEIDEEVLEEEYIEDELEKTQAQIRVEEITKALEEAGVDEKIEEDKYAKFEEEQEKNAFISYEDLKNNYDRLYEENEKTQYIEDNTIPINIKELYEAAGQEELKNNSVETLTDTEVNTASSFLTNLKELRDNLN